MIDYAEFFIAENRSEPGGMRSHQNICVNNFEDAWKFACSSDCYYVFWYTCEMLVYHYKIENDVVSLVKTYDLNDYVLGAILKKDFEFVSAEEMEDKNGKYYNNMQIGDKDCKVVYKKSPTVENYDPLPKNCSVMIQLPDQDDPSKFKIGYGYAWEDSGDFINWDEIWSKNQTDEQPKTSPTKSPPSFYFPRKTKR